MLNRKQSVRIADASTLIDVLGADLPLLLGSPIASNTPLSATTECAAANLTAHQKNAVPSASTPNLASVTQDNTTKKAFWFNKTSVRHFMRLCSIASLLSVCANTSRTFLLYPKLVLVTFFIDLISAIVFTFEIVLKLYSRHLLIATTTAATTTTTTTSTSGLSNHNLFAGSGAPATGSRSYATSDRWCQFDALMVIFIWISLTLQVFEMFHLVGPYSMLSVLRSPRPLILVRFIRVFLKFSIPKSRIKQIFKRSSQQIYNVTLFFLFFMTLYGLLGVQLFGQIEKHCVVNGTSLEDITVNSLAIPDTHCSGSARFGNQCPPGMVCLDLHLPKEIVGYNGFDHIGHSLYTVYQTSSQEGWSHLMYSTFDHYPAWKVAAYFVSLIFFLGWMVRNVFIAVFTETFNEIRVQFQQMWGERQSLANTSVLKLLRGDDSGWQLVELDACDTTHKCVPKLARKFLNSAAFQVIVFCAVLANVTMLASIKFEHNGQAREHFYTHLYWFEVGFTTFFNIECAFKIICLGTHNYWSRASHRFELCLAIGCTLNLIPQLFMTELTNFQVLRVIRLIKASPVLEDFAYKSFGPARKLGSLILFTGCLLIVTSTMTMQLFCCLGESYHRFQDFPHSFMSMFQILTQEAWTDVMNETMLRVGDSIGPYVAVYFIMYHLFVSLIVLSLFVAVILDNLELPEDLKKAKQEKAREQIACISEELPLRLRVFEHFPDSPQMTKLNKLATSEFNVPKVRESFMRHFVDNVHADATYSTIRNCLERSKLIKTLDVKSSRPTGKSQQNPSPLAFISSGARRRQLSFKDPKQQQQKQQLQQPLFGAKLKRKTISKISSDKLVRPRDALAVLQQAPPMRRVAPTIKLLTGATLLKRAPTNSDVVLRKTTIERLIEISNLQRVSLTSGARKQSAAAPGFHQQQQQQQQQEQKQQQQQQQQIQQQQQKQQPTFNSSRDPLSSANVASSSWSMVGARPSLSPYVLDTCLVSDATTTTTGDMLHETTNLARNPQDLNLKMLKRKRQQAELKRSQREKDLRENHPLFDTPLFVVGRESKFRKFCQWLSRARYAYTDRDPSTGKLRKSNYKSMHNLLGLVSYFDWLMIIVTTISSISMMFETPTMRVMNTPVLRLAEWAFVAAMSVELCVKTLANGLVFTPRALLSSVAGLMDAFVFVTSLAYALWMPQEVEPQSMAQYLMLLRCVRPLRIFSLVPHMRQVVYELVRGFKAIFLVCVLLGLLCFVFACYGVHIFGGRLARCTDPSIGTRELCTGTFLRKVFVTKMRVPTDDQTYPAILVPRVWANPHRFSFDDIKSAMLALFEVLSFKGWVDIREALLKRFDNSPHWLYIHIFVFFGCMVGVTLFVGVVIANYGENKGTALLTVDQRRWCDLKKRLKIAQPLHLPPRPDHVKCRAIIYDIIQNILFKRLIAILVLCNSSLLIVHWDESNDNNSHATSLTPMSFSTISAWLTLAFVIEALLKMIAFTPHGYWQSRRNRYDLVVTLIGCLWVLVHFVLAQTWHMRQASNTFGFIVVILRFFTITGLFVLVLFYSLLGVQLFGSIKYGENLSRQANFRSAKLGIITMFRIVTGEDWYRMMHDCMIAPPYCTAGKNYWQTDCGHFGISFVFFSSFYIIITHIVLNLLVAIIMENFSLFYSSEEDALLSYADIRNFQNTWNMVDTQQRGSIPVRRIKFVLRLLKGRLEVDPTRDQHLIKHMCHEMERLHNGEDVSFHDVLSMLSYRSVDINKSLQFEELLARNELENIIEEEVAKKTIRSWLDQCLRRIRKERQAHNSLIQGLRLSNLGEAELSSFMSSCGALASPDEELAPVHEPSTKVVLTPTAPTAPTLTVSASSSRGDFTTSPKMSGGPQQASGSDSQHSITSAATIATIAATISKLKRRVEASRAAESGGGGGQAASEPSGNATVGGAQRKLLASTPSEHSNRKEADRAAQLRRVLKALTSSGSNRASFVGAVAAAAAAAGKGVAPELSGEQRERDTEAARLKEQQYKPQLNAAINDIHDWWRMQVN